MEKLFSKDELLDNVMQYWLAGPSVRPFSYREEWVSGSLKPGQRVEVPAALASPPKDGPVPPRAFAARTLVDLRRQHRAGPGRTLRGHGVPRALRRRPAGVLQRAAAIGPLIQAPSVAGRPDPDQAPGHPVQRTQARA